MDVEKIITEDPRLEQWRKINQFAYEENLKRMNPDLHSKLSQFIIGSIHQAEAYFNASALAPLDISPQLLYYGTTNLMAAAFAIRTWQIPEVKRHGLKLHGEEEIVKSRLGESVVEMQTFPRGGWKVLGSFFSNSVPNQPWKLRVKELFAAIPDIDDEYFRCYDDPPGILPVNTVKRNARFLEVIPTEALTRFGTSFNLLDRAPYVSKYYLSPSMTDHYIVLNRKLETKELPPLFIYNLSGSSYLPLPFRLGDKLIPLHPVLHFFLCLYALGYVSRYRPELWNPFVTSTISTERLLIERFMQVSRRYVPNLILNKILNVRIQFSYA
jgi:hypothetical protein